MIKFRFLTYANFGLFEKWYEDMAKDGYEIESQKFSFIHFFKKTTPKDVNYKFSLARNEGKYNAFSKEEKREYDDLARDMGWDLVFRSYNMNLYKVDEGASSLYEDERDQIKILNEGVRGEIISTSILLVVLLFLSLSMGRRFISVDFFYSNSNLFLFPGIVLCLIFDILALMDYVIFRNKNKDNVKDISKLTFSKLSFSKFFVTLVIIIIILGFLGIASQISGLIPVQGAKLTLTLWLPLILVYVLVFIYRKKVKSARIKTETKKNLFKVLIAVVFFGIFFGNYYLVQSSIDVNPPSKKIGSYEVNELEKSVFIKDHKLYQSDNLNLIIEKTVCKNESISRELFERLIKDRRKTSYFKYYVWNLSESFNYEKTYKISKGHGYLILWKDTILKISGNINEDAIKTEVDKFLK